MYTEQRNYSLIDETGFLTYMVPLKKATIYYLKKDEFLTKEKLESIITDIEDRGGVVASIRLCYSSLESLKRWQDFDAPSVEKIDSLNWIGKFHSKYSIDIYLDPCLSMDEVMIVRVSE